MPFVKNYNDTQVKLEPPAPLLEIVLSNPSGLTVPSTAVEALIDSGADITVIPRRFVEQLQLKLIDQLPVAGYEGSGSERLVDVYSAKVVIQNVGEYVIRVLPSNDNLVLLGRDIINYWDLFLHGKANIFEIS